MSATTTLWTPAYGAAALERINCIEGWYLYQSGAALAGTVNPATGTIDGSVMNLLSSSHCTPSNCSVGVSRGRFGRLTKYVFAPGTESKTVPPSSDVMLRMFATGETLMMTGTAACALIEKTKTNSKQI